MSDTEQGALFELPGPAPVDTDDLLAESHEVMARVIAEHKPSRVAILFSGGNDSLVLLDTMARYADEIVTIDTGIGIPETLAFGRRAAKRYRVPHTVLRPDATTLANGTRNQSYEQCVLGEGGTANWRGLPGPGMHGRVYNRLKQRPLEHWLRFHRRFNGERFALLTGIRSAESVRRMGYKDPVNRLGGQVWVNPLLKWPNANMGEYRQGASLPVNEVSANLHMSGECLCGAMADQRPKREEREALKFFYPEWERERLVPLENECRRRGLPYDEWGVKRTDKPDQGGPMCTSCDWRGTLFDASVIETAVPLARPSDPQETPNG